MDGKSRYSVRSRYEMSVSDIYASYGSTKVEYLIGYSEAVSSSKAGAVARDETPRHELRMLIYGSPANDIRSDVTNTN